MISPSILRKIKTSDANGCHMEWKAKKIVVVGDKGSGKTSLITQFTMGHPCLDSRNSDFGYNDTVPYGIVARLGGQLVSINIWDTDSGDRAEILRAQCYKDADCVIIMFSVVDLQV